MSTSTRHDPRTPCNVILADQTIVLMWIVKAETIRQYSVGDMKQAEVELADFEAVILDKQTKYLKHIAFATFELNGNHYVIDSGSLGVGHKINRKSVHLRQIWLSARSFFPQ